ncbi:MAG: uridine kinase [Opitutaceae bacterium]|nr:uridine kinase [Opitutaceae bacterium]
MKTFVIGIAGGTGSGKTTFTKAVLDDIQPSEGVHLSHDSYYKDHGDADGARAHPINYDHPDALETSLLVEHVQELCAGRAIAQPQYDFATHRRRTEPKRVEPRPIILVEGILLFADPRLRDLFDLKVYIDVDDDERALRRLSRDLAERGRTVDSILEQYRSSVKPMHEQYVAPSKLWADIIVPRGGENRAAVALLVEVVRSRLRGDR